MNNKLPSVTKLAFKAGLGAYLGFQCAKFVDLTVTAVAKPFADKLIDKINAKTAEVKARTNS